MVPSIFVAHGSPMLAVEENQYTNDLRTLGEQIRPRAVVLLSAHYESAVQRVGTAERYRTIHDFGGFPDSLYRIEYPAVGEPVVAEGVGRRLAEQGVAFAYDGERGLDHGAWVILQKMYPQADVPVVSMSVNADLSPQEQYRVGQALAGLRQEDVLVLASGATVHNFSYMRLAEPGREDGWAREFDDWILRRAAQWDLEGLFAYESLAPYATRAVPPHGREHFIPLFYAMGAADDQRTARELHRSYQYGSLSHVIWQFGG